MRHVITGVIGMLAILLGAWITGFDFNTRGIAAGFIYICTVFVGILVTAASKDLLGDEDRAMETENENLRKQVADLQEALDNLAPYGKAEDDN